MAYEPLNLTDGHVLTAADIKHIEDGIIAASGGTVTPDVKRLTIDKTTATGAAGSDVTLGVTASDGATGLTVTWTSSDTNVAAFTKLGAAPMHKILTLLKEGKTTITAHVDGYEDDSFEFTVTSATGTPRPVDVFVGDSITAGQGVPAEQRWTRLVADKAQHDEINVGVGGAGFDKTQVDTSGANTVSNQLDKAATLAKGRDVSRVFIESFRNDYLGHKTDIDAYQSAYSKLVTDALVKAKNLFPDVPVYFIPSIIPPSPTMTGEKETIDKMLAVSVTAAATVPDVTVMDGDSCWNLLAGTTGTWQSDGVHPTASGHAKAAEGIESWLSPTVSRNLLSYGPASANQMTVSVNPDKSLQIVYFNTRQWKGVEFEQDASLYKPGARYMLSANRAFLQDGNLLAALRFNDDSTYDMQIKTNSAGALFKAVRAPENITKVTFMIRAAKNMDNTRHEINPCELMVEVTDSAQPSAWEPGTIIGSEPAVSSTIGFDSPKANG